MTPRPRPSKNSTMRLRAASLTRRHLLAGTAGIAALGAVAGCDPRQAMFFLQPHDPRTPAECPSLKGKRVVILTATSAAVMNEVGVDRELAAGLAKELRANVKKIDVVDPTKVAAWTTAKPNWTDPAEAARAFEAEIVIFLEINQFEVESPSSPDMFQGRSNISIRVIEWAHPKDDRGKPIETREKESTIVFDGGRETLFPNTGGVPVEAGVGRATFKNKFTKLVIAELSWTFLGRAHGDEIQDTRIRD